MLAIMVDIAVNGQSEAVRLAAADKVIDRAMGKAPAHIDITAMRLENGCIAVMLNVA